MRNKADLIKKISLLKQKIDKCLDERDRESFNQLSLELKVCQNYLETCFTNTEVHFKKPFEQKRGKFFNH
uniref:IDEAL domain-containing protein n=1 Tax=Neobacillus sp. FSL H8-0543 TaxID=2954672 RepID=UPI00406C798C